MTDRRTDGARSPRLLREAVSAVLFVALALCACGSASTVEREPSFGPVAEPRPPASAPTEAPTEASLRTPPSAAPAPEAQQVPGEPRWRVVAVEYARSRAIPRGRLVRGGSRGGSVDMSWYFFVARRGDRVVLIDCGTNALSRSPSAQRSRWSITEAVPIPEALRRVDLSPGDVTDIILTHRHWDHVGALGLFRAARVHVHPDEWRSLASALRRPVEASGRLRQARGAAPSGEVILPGLRVRESGRHTDHQLMVAVDCDAGPVTIAGDAAYLYANIEDALPVTVTTDPQGNVSDVAAAASEVGAGRVIPGHDPELFRRFPSPDPLVAVICP